MAGLWCTALGYSNQELIETAYEQMKKLPFTHIFGGRSHDPAIELAEKLKEIAPVMLEEWSRDKKVVTHASWLHEKEFSA